MASISQILTGTPGKATPLPIYEEPQRQVFSNLLQQGQAAVNPSAISQLARNQFATNTIPSISERFTASGRGGQRSSAFTGALGSAASQLETNLAALQHQQGMEQLKLGLTPQYEYLYQPEQPGLLEQGATSLTQSLAQAAPGLAQKGIEYLLNRPQQAPQPATSVPSAFPSPTPPPAGVSALQQQPLKPGEQAKASYQTGSFTPPTPPSAAAMALENAAAQGGATLASTAATAAGAALGLGTGAAIAIGAGLPLAGYGIYRLYNWLNSEEE